LPSPCDAAIGAPARPKTGLFAKMHYKVYTYIFLSARHAHTKRDKNYLKMQRGRQKTIYQGACLLGSKCGKTHLRPSVKSKNFRRVTPGPPKKRRKGRAGEGRTGEGKGGGRGWKNGMRKEGKGKGREAEEEGRGEEREREGREMEGTPFTGHLAQHYQVALPGNSLKPRHCEWSASSSRSIDRTLPRKFQRRSTQNVGELTGFFPTVKTCISAPPPF
jgi:hypothetical protein